MCITRAAYCDGYVDCADSSDEVACAVTHGKWVISSSHVVVPRSPHDYSYFCITPFGTLSDTLTMRRVWSGSVPVLEWHLHFPVGSLQRFPGLPGRRRWEKLPCVQQRSVPVRTKTSHNCCNWSHVSKFSFDIFVLVASLPTSASRSKRSAMESKIVRILEMRLDAVRIYLELVPHPYIRLFFKVQFSLAAALDDN